MNIIPRNILKPVLLAAGLSLTLPLAAYAIGGGEHCGGPMMHGAMGAGGPEGFGMHLPPFLHDLKLSESQRDQIFKIMHEQAPVMREKGKEARKAHDDLRALAFSAQYDEAKVKSAAESEARAMAEMAEIRLRSGNQIYQLLTAEQKKKAEELKAEFEARGPGRHHGRLPTESRDSRKG